MLSVVVVARSTGGHAEAGATGGRRQEQGEEEAVAMRNIGSRSAVVGAVLPYASQWRLGRGCWGWAGSELTVVQVEIATRRSARLRGQPITTARCCAQIAATTRPFVSFRLVLSREASRMPAPIQSASRLQPVHLLRALLREASYLPDALARTYFRQYIVNRFKAYQPKQNATASFDLQAVERYRHRSFKRRQIAIIHERTRPLLRKGQKGLNFLRRANLGEILCLRKVLFFTYGRIGRRKYTLLENLLRPDPVVGNEAVPAVPDASLAPLQELYHSNKRYLQYFSAPKASSKTHYTIGISDRYSRLRSVIQTQHQKGVALNKQLKNSSLKTPINNVWERPMPIKRARNNVKRWYAETMTRLLPPLPNHEWDNMHAMIVGEKWVSLTKRRTPSSIMESASSQDEERFADIMKAGIALDKPSQADMPAGIRRPHNITTKFMRRLYTKILMLCCKLEYDNEQRRWKAIWGTPMMAISPKLCLANMDDSLFAGVDATGRLPKEPKKMKIGVAQAIHPRSANGTFVRFPFFTEFLPKSHPLRQELDAWKKARADAEKEARHLALRTETETAVGGEATSKRRP